MNQEPSDSLDILLDLSGDSGAGSPKAPEPEPKILLAEEPTPRKVTPRTFEPLPDDTPFVPADPEPQATARPSRLAPIKSMVAEVYFDPAKAFAAEVDWSRFRKAQISLFGLSLAMPFIMLLLLGVILGVVYHAGASLYNATTPNPIYQLMLYPLVFVLARGYWMAYLALPLILFGVGWLWAAVTAGALSRIEDGAHIDYKTALSILAMLGAMLAPFTMFPFLRLLALAVIFWFTIRRLEDTFGIGFWTVAGRGGLTLVASMFLYGAMERKVESLFPAGEEMKVNLNAFVNQRKMLEWPSFHEKIYVKPNERLYADLTNFTPQIRDLATQKAMNLLKAGSDTPEFRYRLAQRLAENGQNEAFLYLSRYAAAGQGTPLDAAAALVWIQKYTLANPNNLDVNLDKVRLLIQNNRRLEGKRLLVSLVKAQLTDMNRITDFIQKEGLGQTNSGFNDEVQNLYQFGNGTNYVGSYTPSSGSSSGYSRYGYETQTKQEGLLKRLFVNEHDNSLWFYRAMVVEYNRSAEAGPEIYGEIPTIMGQAELDQKIQEGDPIAMDILADRSARDGDIAKARQYWLAAIRVLDSDNRYPNVAYYMKLAESYDPAESDKAADPAQATKYYLAALLISSWQGRGIPVGLKPLQRLQPGKLSDPRGQPFLDTCLKYDIPEAWAMMGDRYFNGDFPGVPKNIAKGRDCFMKAQALGYKGPQFQKQLALMGAATATR
ncbi:hypothetical protein GETHLI_16390 [Geothrix limicola]|uniref:Sel1 repeat family protein n=1 Tax=Geothrix limicola TaxID=2927978 RepID=A0ABQ5QER0_9BACT|nr:hypothetical protein [Geothrix limicola]GLH73137.1 hypothetical protein GETHLI_16390 [Geothrix limicola]